MSNYTLTNIYEKGLYSDISLKINGKTYNLHKSLVDRSIFFKTLINNIGIMSTDEEIEIVSISGNLIEPKLVDDVLKWLYTSEKLDVHELMDEILAEKTSLCVMLKYYSIIDYLQISGAIDDVIKMINTKLRRCNQKYVFPSIVKEDGGLVYKYGTEEYDMYSEIQFRRILGIIYGDFQKIEKYHQIIKNKKIGEHVCDAYIYDKLINCIYEKDKNIIIEMCIKYYRDSGNTRDYILRNILTLRQYIVNEYSRHLYYVPQSSHGKICLSSAKLLLDIASGDNKTKIIELLDIDDWYKDGKIILENVNVVRDICKEYDMEDIFNKKFKAFAFIYL